MAIYKTFNIKFTDWYDNEKEYYEVAENVAGALAKFYDEVKEDGGLTRILDIWEDDMKYGYVMTDDEGDQFWYGFPTASAMFYDLSKTIAFNDCCPYHSIDGIKCGGRSAYYVGWSPNNLFEYRYSAGNEVAWEQCYPSFEH